MKISVITAIEPNRLSKKFSLVNNEIVKTSGGELIKGILHTVECKDLTDLAMELDKLVSIQAIVWGRCIHEQASIVTEKKMKELGFTIENSKTVSRTKEYFSWHNTNSVMMLDYDPRKGELPLLPNELLDILYKVWPELSKAPHIVRPSASSYIYQNGTQYIGQRGLRILISVKDGTDIERAGNILFKKLWLKEYGYIVLSGIGAKLIRTIIDNTVWQPNRLDFCGGAECDGTITQKMPPTIFKNINADCIDTKNTLKDFTLGEDKDYIAKIKNAKDLLEVQANKIKDAWVEKKVAKKMSLPKISKLTQANQKEYKTKIWKEYSSMIKDGILLGDFVLTTRDGDDVKVEEILNDPERYHNSSFCDPIEPQYKNDSRIAKVYLYTTGRPYIWSYAHGGKRYTLYRVLATIDVVVGEELQIINRIMEIALLNGNLFQRGGELVRVSSSNEIIVQDIEKILLYLYGAAQWKKYDKKADSWRVTSAPRNIAAGLIASKGNWKVPKINGIVTAPIMDLPSDRIIQKDGFDKKTGIMVVLDNFDSWNIVPKNPTIDEAREALKIIWEPFKNFPFDGAISRGVQLSTIFTAINRQALTTAPGTSVIAPTAGSGKTLNAKSFSILAGSMYPAMLPITEGKEAGEEVRKRLLSLGREGQNVIILDNIIGTFSSTALCTWLTSEFYIDRILGQSDMSNIPTRSLVLLTGNNIIIKGDLCRRILICNIDPQMETPWKRAFKIDPAEYCKKNRLKIVSASLTVLRYAIQNGTRPTDRTASFETWSDTIRMAVIEANKLDVDGLTFKDPIESINASYDIDPETQKLGAALFAIYDIFQNREWKVANVIQEVLKDQALVTPSFTQDSNTTQQNAGNLAEVIEEIAGQRGVINSRMLGRWVEKNVGKIVDDLKFKRMATKHKTVYWKIVKIRKPIKRPS